MAQGLVVSTGRQPASSEPEPPEGVQAMHRIRWIQLAADVALQVSLPVSTPYPIFVGQPDSRCRSCLGSTGPRIRRCGLTDRKSAGSHIHVSGSVFQHCRSGGGGLAGFCWKKSKQNRAENSP